MGKKILQSLLIITLLSSFANATQENDTPKEEYITISRQQLEEHKNQIILLNEKEIRIEKTQIDQHEQTVQEFQNLRQEFSYLKQQNIRLEQEVVEVNQQNAEIKQQNIELNQKLDIQIQQNMQTNAFLKELLQKFK